MRADSGFYAHAIVAVCRKMDVRYSITIRQHKSLRNLIEAIREADWTPIPYWMDGAADVAEITSTPFRTEPGAAPARLIVRRVKPAPGSQLALLARYSYHGFITDRDGETLELEADHRRHAEVENAIGAPQNACRPPPTPHLPEFELGPSRVLLPHPPFKCPHAVRRWIRAKVQQRERRSSSPRRSRRRIGRTINAVSYCSCNVATLPHLLPSVITSVVHDSTTPVAQLLGAIDSPDPVARLSTATNAHTFVHLFIQIHHFSFTNMSRMFTNFLRTVDIFKTFVSTSLNWNDTAFMYRFCCSFNT